MDLFKAEVCGEAGLAETAFGPKQPSALARSQAWRFMSSIVPSQTGGLVHAQAIKSDSTPLQSTIKIFKRAGSIETFGTKKN